MITAHKVLAAYACLAPRIVTGQFDPTRHRAIWPSTGNYARGGIAISRIMASRGVAILPAGMSQERFDWLDAVVREPGRRRDPHARHGEQRQGDLRRVQRAGEGSRRTSCSTSSASSATTSATTRSPGARSAHVFDVRARGVGSRSAAGCVRVGHRIGRHDRRRRPAEGRVRHADRRRRGARVPDDARERLRRAQHPGHRRQAHPVDPQRDEHRRRRARSAIVRPTSSTCCSTRDAGRGLPRRPQVDRRRRHRRARPLRVLEHLQRAGRDQDREAARPRRRRRDHHGRHRRRRDVPERAGQDAGRAASAGTSTPSTPARSSASTSPT